MTATNKPNSQSITNYLKRTTAILMAVVLAVTLTPIAPASTTREAYAATGLATTNAHTATAQKATTTMKVLVRKPLFDDSYWNQTFTYKSNGLLSRMRDEDNDYNVVSRFGYNSRGDVTSYTMKGDTGTSFSSFSDSKTTVTRTKSGLPTKEVTRFTRGLSKGAVRTIGCTVKSGKVRSAKLTYKRKGGKSTLCATYGFTYKNKRLQTRSSKDYETVAGKLKVVRKGRITFIYDAAGNLKKVKSSGSYASHVHMDLLGRLAIRTDSKKCTFKKIKVPKALVPKVRAQQWALLNSNLNFVF